MFSNWDRGDTTIGWPYCKVGWSHTTSGGFAHQTPEELGNIVYARGAPTGRAWVAPSAWGQAWGRPWAPTTTLSHPRARMNKPQWWQSSPFWSPWCSTLHQWGWWRWATPSVHQSQSKHHYSGKSPLDNAWAIHSGGEMSQWWAPWLPKVCSNTAGWKFFVFVMWARHRAAYSTPLETKGRPQSILSLKRPWVQQGRDGVRLPQK